MYSGLDFSSFHQVTLLHVFGLQSKFKYCYKDKFIVYKSSENLCNSILLLCSSGQKCSNNQFNLQICDWTGLLIPLHIKNHLLFLFIQTLFLLGKEENYYWELKSTYLLFFVKREGTDGLKLIFLDLSLFWVLSTATVLPWGSPWLLAFFREESHY